jgi:hypothetical protein
MKISSGHRFYALTETVMHRPVQLLTLFNGVTMLLTSDEISQVEKSRFCEE